MPQCEDTTAHAVLALLSERAKTSRRVARITPAEMAKILRVSSDAVRSALYDLYDDGDVERLAEGEYCVITPHTCERADLSHSPRRGTLSRSKQKAHSKSTVLTSTTASGSIVSACTDVQEDLETSSLTRANVSPYVKWNARNLAYYFDGEIRCAASAKKVSLGPTPVNLNAMVGNFAAWRREGLSNDTIVQMIDLFVADIVRRARKGVPVWKIFLTYRTSLFRQVEQMQQDARRSEGDTDYWTASSDDDDADISNWIGAN